MNVPQAGRFMLARGPRLFLLLVFGLGYAVQFGLLAGDVPSTENVDLLLSSLLAVLLWVPTLAAVIAIRIFPDSPPLPKLGAPSAMGLLRAACAVPVVFAAFYGVATLLGIDSAHWELQPLRNALLEQSGPSMSPQGLAKVSSGSLIVMLLVLSMIVGATLFMMVALGNEIGWRSYLAPRLWPNRPGWGRAMAGFLWGLWLLPLVYAWHDISGLHREFPGFAVRFLAFTSAFGFALSRVFEASQSIYVTAAFVGVFLAQLQSFWMYLFPVSTPPWTGPFGIVAILVWVLVGCAPRLTCGRPAASRLPPSR